MATVEELRNLNDQCYVDVKPGGSKSDTVSESSSDTDQATARGRWANKTEFFLAIMGYTVGIGSVWRFPIICSRNGGGAFLIPFFLFLISCGGPLYYLEVCLGQFTGKSAALSFEFCPLLKGIGLLQWTLSFTVLWYLILILAWSVYFLYSSCLPSLPWETCGHSWNTEACRAISEMWTSGAGNTSTNTTYAIGNFTTIALPMLTYDPGNISTIALPISPAIKTEEFSSSAFEFWEHQVISRSPGLGDMGGVQLHLVICLFISWVFVVAAVIKGVATLGKVVYVTATVPYIFLTIMFIRGITLDGAMDGVLFYLKPDFGKLLYMQVWLEAAVQVFYSLGPSWGGVITMASYNPFHQRSFWSSTACVMVAGFTSFFNGLVVLTILGFMAKESGLTVEEVARQSGPGLAFVAFPTAISRMPVSRLWSILFFLMLITVVFDSLFGMFETVTGGIIDLFPRQLTSRRVHVNIVCGVGFFVAGLPLTMNGGIYIFQLSDWYFSQFGLLFGSLLELIAICWIYGIDRFCDDIKIMTGRDVSVLLRCTWGLVIPLITVVAFLVLLSKYSAPAYGDGYVYETYAIAIGIFIGMLPVIAVFAIAGGVLWFGKGSLLNRLRHSLHPSSRWLPNHSSERKRYQQKQYEYKDTWRGRFVTNIRGSEDNSIF